MDRILTILTVLPAVSQVRLWLERESPANCASWCESGVRVRIVTKSLEDTHCLLFFLCRLELGPLLLDLSQNGQKEGCTSLRVEE